MAPRPFGEEGSRQDSETKACGRVLAYSRTDYWEEVTTAAQSLIDSGYLVFAITFELL